MSVVIEKAPGEASFWGVAESELFGEGSAPVGAVPEWSVQWISGAKSPVLVADMPAEDGWICHLEGGAEGAVHLVTCAVGGMRKSVVLRVRALADAA